MVVNYHPHRNMYLNLHNTTSEPHEINKQLTTSLNLQGEFRSEVSVLRPIIRIEHENPTSYNYAYIAEFHRYYYIDEIVSVRTNLWDIHLRVDVLMSHKAGIYQSTGIVLATESITDDMYSPGYQWQTKVKKKTDIMAFPQGFSTSPHFILITAGGIVS